MQALSALSNVELLVLDVTDVESVRAAKAKVEEETNGRLDVLVNNASVEPSRPP